MWLSRRHVLQNFAFLDVFYWGTTTVADKLTANMRPKANMLTADLINPVNEEKESV